MQNTRPHSKSLEVAVTQANQTRKQKNVIWRLRPCLTMSLLGKSWEVFRCMQNYQHWLTQVRKFWELLFKLFSFIVGRKKRRRRRRRGKGRKRRRIICIIKPNQKKSSHLKKKIKEIEK